MPRHEHQGWKLFYEERGEGPPVLLLHSLLFDHSIFDEQIAALEGRYRLVAPDLRSHGLSEHKREPRSLWDLMEDQISLLDALGIERAVWVGASVGGPIALRATLKHPERVAGLALISTQGGPEHPQRGPLYEGFAELVAASGWTDELLAGMIRTNFGPGASEELRHTWAERWRAQPTEDMREIMRALTQREDLLADLSGVTVPALVLYGTDDRLALEPGEVEQLVAVLPNVTYQRIPDAGHTLTLEAPHVVTAALAAFLDEVLPG